MAERTPQNSPQTYFSQNLFKAMTTDGWMDGCTYVCTTNYVSKVTMLMTGIWCYLKKLIYTNIYIKAIRILTQNLWRFNTLTSL